MPTQASQLILPNVWILAREPPAIAATATNTAVQAPWTDKEFRATEIPSMPAPEQKIQTGQY
jgi:hypothetical protein